jgi:uncharacterized membrane protein YebE (DUF533 family)
MLEVALLLAMLAAAAADGFLFVREDTVFLIELSSPIVLTAYHLIAR